MARVVIDANVIISSVFGGRPLEAVTRALKEHEVLISEKIVEEMERVLRSLSKKLSPEQIRYLQERFHELLRNAQNIPVRARLSLCRDAKDDHYLSLCKEAGADFLVTGDKDLLDLDPENLKTHGIVSRIVNPVAFLETIS